MPKKRNIDVVRRAKELYQSGYSLPQISIKLPKEFPEIVQISVRTVSRAIHEGAVQPNKKFRELIIK
ncbi:MAG: hypothetical protein SFU98_21595 [Leptospiraceae bacterium]|nr:hypothetical protein [Leptospiraceae bacterium]